MSQTHTQTPTQDPKKAGPKPPFPEQPQPPPGLEAEMEPRPDYGAQSYRGSGRLTGKAALITGGDSGIGRAVALAYAREGADVLISYLSEHEDADETRRLVEDAGRRAVVAPGDVGDREHCEALVQRALDEFGKLDVLVLNAAFQMSHDSLPEHPPEEIERVFRTNILQMFWFCRAAIPHMQPGASIITTSSIQAYEPTPQLLPYSCTKGAIVTFTKGLAQELTPKGIRVNTVAPGPVWTPLIPASMPPEQASEFGKQSPMQRPAQPAELAPAYVFLASPESSYITGEVIGVTGGTPLP
jgi:NAD(P)-dependent dehydrogenase (short-subunit alcohol dehydrogenase family)